MKVTLKRYIGQGGAEFFVLPLAALEDKAEFGYFSGQVVHDTDGTYDAGQYFESWVSAEFEDVVFDLTPSVPACDLNLN